MRRVALALSVVLSSVAVAAPVPKQIGTDAEKLFGTPTEPKDCSITFNKSDKSLTLVAVPSPDQPAKNATSQHVLWSPRTGRQVDGDFDVTVTITLPEQKDGNLTAGLYASYGEKDFVLLGGMMTSRPGQKIFRHGFIKAVITDTVWNAQSGDWKVGPDEYTARLTRQGKTITPYRQVNGKWEVITSADTTHDWPGTGTVGVYVRAVKGEGTATFKEFKLTMPEK